MLTLYFPAVVTDGVASESDSEFNRHFFNLDSTTTVIIIVAGGLFVLLCLGCLICYCCRRRSNRSHLNNINSTGITVFNGTNRPISGDIGGQHIDPSLLLNGGMHKSPEAFQAQMLQHQHHQQMMAPAKSMGDLFNQQQRSQFASNSPMLRHYQQNQNPAAEVWNMQPLCCPQPPANQSQWYPQNHHQQSQQPQQQMSPQNNHPMTMSPHNQQALPPSNHFPGKSKLLILAFYLI